MNTKHYKAASERTDADERALIPAFERTPNKSETRRGEAQHSNEDLRRLALIRLESLKDFLTGDQLAAIGFYEVEPLIVRAVNGYDKAIEACRLAQAVIGGADTSGAGQRAAHSALFVVLANHESEVQP